MTKTRSITKFYKSVNIWQSYQQERGYFAHFARLAMHRYQSIFPSPDEVGRHLGCNTDSGDLYGQHYPRLHGCNTSQQGAWRTYRGDSQ